MNHGSLSDRIMSRYGDTPEGMVESCMEFLRICVQENFTDVVISIKASNTVVMVKTVRLLATVMEQEGMRFPLHLGVTEAGDGEDGRIKSALGIGALLADGLGDTIRVSLSEAPEAEPSLYPRSRCAGIQLSLSHPPRDCRRTQYRWRQSARGHCRTLKRGHGLQSAIHAGLYLYGTFHP